MNQNQNSKFPSWSARLLRAAVFLMLACLFTLTLPLLWAADTNGVTDLPGVGAAASPKDLLLLLITLATPLLIACIKFVAPMIPGRLLPWIAPVIGMLLDQLGNLTGLTNGNPIAGAVLGSAGVGLRELYDQTKNGGAAAVRLLIATVGLSALLLGSGCTTTGGPSQGLSPADARVIVTTATFTGGAVYLSSNPQDRPYFEAAHAALGPILRSTNATPADLLAALQKLPVRELKGENGTLIVGAVATVQGLIGNRVDVDRNEYVSAVARGVFDGLSDLLGRPRGALPLRDGVGTLNFEPRTLNFERGQARTLFMDTAEVKPFTRTLLYLGPPAQTVSVVNVPLVTP